MRSIPSSLSPEVILHSPGQRQKNLDHSGQVFHDLRSDRLGTRAGSSRFNMEQHHLPGQRQGRLLELGDGGNDKGRVPRTAPAHLFCGNITDAETGEPLQLRRRQWKFPQPGGRAGTAGPPGGGARAVDHPGPQGKFATSGERLG